MSHGPAGIAWFRSVRVRIALVVALISLLVSGIVGTVLADRAASAATDALRAEALGRLTVVTDGYALDGRLRFGATLDPTYAPAVVRADLADRAVNRQVTYYDGQRMWASARLGPNVVLTIALDARSLQAQDSARMWALGWAAAAAALGSIVLGWLAGTTLSRRLRRAAVAARAIADGSDAARATQPGRDEVAVLTRAVDDMADAMRRRLLVEKEFTSDVAHELRTPLTGLVSASELLPDGVESDLVRTQVARLRRLVEDLLEVSRLDRAAEPVNLEVVPVDDAVRDSLSRLGPLTEAVRLEVVPASSDLVQVDERRLDRILANLLVNLARHGGGAGVLTIAGNGFELVDEGAGYPDELVELGPRPFHASGASKGSGLGLTIAVKQAAGMGASVEFGRRDGVPGARTTVRFNSATNTAVPVAGLPVADR